MPVKPRTLLEKIWQSHVVVQEPESPAVLYVDLHLIHEVTSPQAFTGLRERGLEVRRPERTLATMDHSIPTTPLSLPMADTQAAAQLQQLADNCAQFGVELLGMDSPRRGIVHVIGPELGRTQPGMTIVCGDSHTSTHGAFGALAFGIGTSEVEHVLASQCLLQEQPKTFEVRVEGKLGAGVSAKDIILALIADIGIGGGSGHVFEFTGAAVRALSIEERMTVCNMSIEGGARVGYVNPDETTYEYIRGRPFAPSEEGWEDAVKYWKSFASDEDAEFDDEISLDGSALGPNVTWGINPGQSVQVDGQLPTVSELPEGERESVSEALEFMEFEQGASIAGTGIDVAFIGSCTNGRISDLREAAKVALGRKVSPGVKALVVPGSRLVSEQAESEGLHEIFMEAGFEWRKAGCSMCLAMNPDKLKGREISASSSNRNFKGRQGSPLGRTLLMSPVMVAAAAIAGEVVDVREMLGD